MNAEEFETKLTAFFLDIEREAGEPLRKLPPVQATMHYETYREILATAQPRQLMSIPFEVDGEDRKFLGCFIVQTTKLPIGEVQIARR